MFKKNHLSLTSSLFLILYLTTGCSFLDNEDGQNFSVTNYGGVRFTEDDVVEKWNAKRFGDAVQLQYFQDEDSNSPRRIVFQIRLEKRNELNQAPLALTDVWYGTQDTLTGNYFNGPQLSGGRVAIQRANFEGELSGLVELFVKYGGSYHARFWVDMRDVE
ncbi:MAG: hypothetical protein AAF564_07875 [Bacteroidota bacterium]